MFFNEFFISVITFILTTIFWAIIINVNYEDHNISTLETKLKYSYDVCENFGGPLTFNSNSITCNDGKIVKVEFPK
ncbi:MAG: hypothetical protein RBT49_06315 [Bacteroidales bacterium]|jgi:hypothetical protein|nr:hypothetical protein [Bacteroidales bacterium]